MYLCLLSTLKRPAEFLRHFGLFLGQSQRRVSLNVTKTAPPPTRPALFFFTNLILIPVLSISPFPPPSPTLLFPLSPLPSLSVFSPHPHPFLHLHLSSPPPAMMSLFSSRLLPSTASLSHCCFVSRSAQLALPPSRPALGSLIAKMTGPCSLLLCFYLAHSSLQSAKSKPLSAVPEPSSAARFRREALPYEAEMYAYPPSEGARGEAYYPGPGLARPGPREMQELERLGLALGRAGGADERLRRALRRLAEESRQRGLEAAYLSRLLQAWGGLGGPGAYGARPGFGYPEGEEEEKEEEEAERRPYYAPEAEMEDEVMEYLVGRILANAEAARVYPRAVERELQPPAQQGPRRVRRSQGTNDLLRVKRLGVEEEEAREVQALRGSRAGGGAHRGHERALLFLPH